MMVTFLRYIAVRRIRSCIVLSVMVLIAMCGLVLVISMTHVNRGALRLEQSYMKQRKVVAFVTSEHITNGYLHPTLDGATKLTELTENNKKVSIILSLPVPEDDKLIVYNRVPKCGSRTVIWIFKTLGKMYNYRYKHSMEFSQQRYNDTGQALLVNRISSLPKPTVFDMHVHFLNFSKFGEKKPIYMNVIRDPINRLVSSYYFNRFGDTVNKFMVSRFKGTKEERYQTFDECVLLNKTECKIERAFYIVPFFCGQDVRCRHPSRWSVEEAKRNVINEYTFVGVLEDMENTMKVFEYILPQYLKGAAGLLKYLDKRKHLMESLKKAGSSPSPKVIEIMKERLSIEYEFYYFVNARFTLIKEELGIV